MGRLPFAVRLAVFAIAVFGSPLVLSCGGDERPSLLLITIDTLRADRLGCYGAHGTRTPHLDRLAAEGTQFADCFTPVPSTAPSHATILSGLYPRNHGIRDNGAVLAESVPLLSEALRSAGYETAAFVSGFPLERRFGFARGFDHFDDRLPDGFTTSEGRVRGTERIAERTVEAFLRWLPESKGPFLAWVHLFDPHSVYSAPPPFRRMYYEGRERDPSNRSLEGIEIPAYHGLAGVTDVRYPIALYEGEVTYTDREIGRLLDGLERGRRPRSVLVVVVGDHGESLTEHGYYFGHSHFLYEPSLSVPLVFRWPGRLPAGRIVAEPVSLVDLAETLLDLLGLGAGWETDGASLVPLLEGEGREPRGVLLERPPVPSGLLFGLREGPWKYLLWEDGTEELYRLDRDPGETRNLAPIETERTVEFRERLLRERIDEVKPDETPLDDETREKLRALGYAG
ncbi:MAG: sulfatase [Candidatus Eisenbacteria bacterium]|nr:sulfatase [Candidatus Eisenbacteria bacterium]